MTCKPIAAFSAILLLAACNQNAPTDTEAPTEAGATTAAGTTATQVGGTGSSTEGAVQPVPDEYAQEGTATR
ncbi:hypothetical protein [Porphyrobacter sp. GA68]|uniref:hypothetical protein n=1 Tax=Porphyrobacter sp. GA68 TaxID=2883480 RepID=UPI001D1965AB|nr:hypothetical protein [Porphyrobacter sp. GA68]